MCGMTLTITNCMDTRKCIVRVSDGMGNEKKRENEEVIVLDGVIFIK